MHEAEDVETKGRQTQKPSAGGAGLGRDADSNHCPNHEDTTDPAENQEAAFLPSRTILAEVGGYTPVIDALVTELGTMPALVYGNVWRFCNLKDGVCRASVRKLAKRIGVSPETVRRCLRVLCEAGYLRDRDPGQRGRPHILVDTGKVKIEVLVQARKESLVTETKLDERQDVSLVTETKLSLATETKLDPEEARSLVTETNKETTSVVGRERKKLEESNNNTDAVEQSLQALLSIGFTPKSKAREYAEKYSTEDILGWVQFAKRQNLGAGFVRKQLDNGEKPPHPIRENFSEKPERLDALFDLDARERHERYGSDTRGPLVENLAESKQVRDLKVIEDWGKRRGAGSLFGLDADEPETADG